MGRRPHAECLTWPRSGPPAECHVVMIVGYAECHRVGPQAGPRDMQSVRLGPHLQAGLSRIVETRMQCSTEAETKKQQTYMNMYMNLL